jgi:uncharacterized membrane protein
LKSEEQEDSAIDIPSKLMAFIFLGFVLVLVGIIVLAIVALVFGVPGSVGGIIFIGPIPIVFGAGPDAELLIIISVVLAVLIVLIFMIMNRSLRRLKFLMV